MSLIPESKDLELSCYSNNKAWLFDVNVTIHFLLNSGRLILNDERIRLLLLIKAVLDEKGHGFQFFMENYKGGVAYLFQSTFLLNFHSIPRQD